MSARVPVAMTVNGLAVTAEVDPRLPLATFLRDHLRLTGTHVGCDSSQCGACTVLVDGVGLKSCTLFAVQADGAAVTSVEGVGTPESLHPLQAAFQEHHGLQCGYCTPGMIMSALDMMRREPVLNEETVRRNLHGNICRCTGYYNIVKAILHGARAMGHAVRLPGEAEAA